MSELFSITIELDRLFSKKNSRPIHINRRTGKRFIGKSNELKAYENYLVFEMKRKAIELYFFTINEPVRLRIEFYLKDYFTKTKKFNMKQPDLDNLLCGPLDALQRAGIIQNDNLVVEILASKNPSDTEQNYFKLSLEELS